MQMRMTHTTRWAWMAMISLGLVTAAPALALAASTATPTLAGDGAPAVKVARVATARIQGNYSALHPRSKSPLVRR